jgi:hypothetical protein
MEARSGVMSCGARVAQQLVQRAHRIIVKGMHIGYWWEDEKERDHWEDQGVGGWTILKWILEK